MVFILTPDMTIELKKTCQLNNASILQRQKWRLCNEQLQNGQKCALAPMEFKFHLYWILAGK